MLLMLGAKDLATYWSDRTFDGFSVIPIPVSSDERKVTFSSLLLKLKGSFDLR